MTVYIPKAFALREPAQVLRLVSEHPFATLVTPGPSGPQVTHLPFQLAADRGPHGTLLGHMARANPHWQHFGDGPSVAIFHGPHAYVSPSWYAEPATAVPTWNYAVAHLHGSAQVVDDERAKRVLLDEMIERYEGSRPRPWQLQLEGRALEAMLGAIVAFELRVERVDAKFKLSQNRGVEDRERVIQALRAEGYADASATADWMDAYSREP